MQQYMKTNIHPTASGYMEMNMLGKKSQFENIYLMLVNILRDIQGHILCYNDKSVTEALTETYLMKTISNIL